MDSNEGSKDEILDTFNSIWKGLKLKRRNSSTSRNICKERISVCYEKTKGENGGEFQGYLPLGDFQGQLPVPVFSAEKSFVQEPKSACVLKFRKIRDSEPSIRQGRVFVMWWTLMSKMLVVRNGKINLNMTSASISQYRLTKDPPTLSNEAICAKQAEISRQNVKLAAWQGQRARARLRRNVIGRDSALNYFPRIRDGCVAKHQMQSGIA